jgi:hypothetical protein
MNEKSEEARRKQAISYLNQLLENMDTTDNEQLALLKSLEKCFNQEKAEFYIRYPSPCLRKGILTG